jgi:hypothetical protein
MTVQERALYNRIAKLQGTLFKLIGNLESIKIELAGDPQQQQGVSEV